MPSKRHKQQQGQVDKYAQAFFAGSALVAKHPVFHILYDEVSVNIRNDYNTNLCPKGGLAVVTSQGALHVRFGTLLLDPEEWAYVIAHCLLHLAFDHFQARYLTNWSLWSVACDCVIYRFLADLKFGSPLQVYNDSIHQIELFDFKMRDEQELYENLSLRVSPVDLPVTSMTLASHSDMVFITPAQVSNQKIDWPTLFSRGLQSAVSNAIEESGGRITGDSFSQNKNSLEVKEARNWFITHFPLLGSLAATFTVIEDADICRRIDVRIAAVSVERQEIYINPHAGLKGPELRFVMAHEFLHAGLRHDVRCEGRDPYLWNIACDYVINGWLVEMGVGEMPIRGGMYDPTLKNESSEAIYDRIVRDLRVYRKMITMRGGMQSDILDTSGWQAGSDGVDLDEFYRSCLSQGLQMHEMQGRGLLPSGLIEEIRALSQPAIPWDVELAKWFDERFPPLEMKRSYTRLSRRQSSTPDIPRPQWVRPEEINKQHRRTYGVLLDTSGSMSSEMLAKALGTIASYSIAREVDAVRVIFCDAITYDQGYMAPEDIAGSVKIRGRGGTILQPGINLLERADDFPPDGPILIITDGLCDRVKVLRDHAYLMPKKSTLPFPPRGPVYKIPVQVE